MNKLVNKLNLDNKGKEILRNLLDQFRENNSLGYYSLRTGKVAAGNAISRTRERIMENPDNYNLLESNFNREMTPEEFDKLIDSAMNYDKRNKKNSRYLGPNTPPSALGNLATRFGKNILTNGADYAVQVMTALATGNPQALNAIASNIVGNVGGVLKDTLTNLGTKASSILFGTKNEQGEREDGLFSSVINETKDAFLGKADDHGKREGGIVGNIKTAFNAGVNGWLETFFGKKEGESDEDMRKRLKGEVEARMPQAARGGLGGALIGGLLGHPFIGAAIGSATGFMMKSDTFQKWLFGDDIDPDHPDKGKTGGLISKEIQDYFRNNKTELAKNTGVGAVAGGALGMLVGGPLTGAMLGAATGIISKTGVFQRFLFGDEKTGHKGLINGVKEAFGKGAGEYTDSELKSIGMSGIGALGGAAFATFANAHGLLGAMMFPGGPIGGAIAGLALTIKAQEGSIREWLFGGGKETIKGKEFTKNGLLGQIANNLNARIFNPLKTEISYHLGNLFNRIEHHVLTPISLISQFVAKRVVSMFKNGGNLLTKLATAPFKMLNNVLGGRLAELGKIPIAIGGAMATAAGRALSAPGRAVMNILGAFDPDLYAQGLGAKRSFKENLENLRQGRKAERQFNKMDQAINKATRGRYATDSPEARDYLRLTNERAYNKLFFNKDGTEKESRSSALDKARIEREGKRLSNLFKVGSNGKVNVNAMSIEERQTYYAYKQTEYLRQLLNVEKKKTGDKEIAREEIDHRDNTNENITYDAHGKYKTAAEVINKNYNKLREATKGKGIVGFLNRRRYEALRRHDLRNAADLTFNEKDADSVLGRGIEGVKRWFSGGEGGRGTIITTYCIN